MPDLTEIMSVKNVVATIAAISAIGGAVLGFEARYNDKPQIEALKTEMTTNKNEIINEVRTHIAVVQSALLSSMQQDADDIEYEINTYTSRNQQAPQHLVEKYKRITRDIEKLKADETTASPTP